MSQTIIIFIATLVIGLQVSSAKASTDCSDFRMFKELEKLRGNHLLNQCHLSVHISQVQTLTADNKWIDQNKVQVFAQDLTDGGPSSYQGFFGVGFLVPVSCTQQDPPLRELVYERSYLHGRQIETEYIALEYDGGSLSFLEMARFSSESGQPLKIVNCDLLPFGGFQ